MNTSLDLRVLAETVSGIHIAMLTTVAADGRLRSRPMALQEVDDEGGLWFFADRTTHVVEELIAHPQINITFVRHEDGTYVSVSGQAHLHDDHDLMRELWYEDYRVWFPGGLSDPGLTLVRVAPDLAESWDHGVHRTQDAGV